MNATETKVRNILVVEDDYDMQEMYKMIFKNYADDYNITIEGKAKSGLKKLKEKKYDLIILDIIMEPVTGDSFFIDARSSAKTQHIPILVISVLSEETLVGLRQIDTKNFYILQKPITEEQLLNKIKSILD